MSTFVVSKQHLREVLIYFFNLKKTASEAHRLLTEAYPDYAVDVRMCQRWFARFRDGDFDVEDKERAGREKKFEDEQLEALLDEDPCQTQEELAKSLGVTQAAISQRLKAAGFIQKHGNWVPHELKPRDVERRYFTCEQLLQRQIIDNSILKMSKFEPSKHHLREVMLFYFNQKKKAVYCHRVLKEVYGDNAPAINTVEEWYRRFKSGDFSLEDKERTGQPKKFENDDLKALLEQDPTQTLKGLGEKLNVSGAAISKRLKMMRMTQRQGRWVPYGPREND